MKKILVLLLLALASCQKPRNSELRFDLNPFVGSSKTKLALKYPKDINGYYQVPISATLNSNRFDVFIEASTLIPRYQYNGTSVIQAKFDCNTYWVLGTGVGDLTVRIPLYSPFSSLYSSPYFTTPISVRNIVVTLNQYKNSIIPVVQETGVYLKEYFGGSLTKPADEYQPDPGMYWSKRIVGPIPGYFKGDTIKIYSQVDWDAGIYTYLHPTETTRRDSVQIIFK